MDVKIYDNYSVLAHEKQHVYTIAPESTASLSESFYIIIPYSMNPYITEVGEIAIIPPNSFKYLLAECLETGHDGMPVITWIDKNGSKCTYDLGTYSA